MRTRLVCCLWSVATACVSSQRSVRDPAESPCASTLFQLAVVGGVTVGRSTVDDVVQWFGTAPHLRDPHAAAAPLMLCYAGGGVQTTFFFGPAGAWNTLTGYEIRVAGSQPAMQCSRLVSSPKLLEQVEMSRKVTKLKGDGHVAVSHEERLGDWDVASGWEEDWKGKRLVRVQVYCTVTN